MDTVVGLYLPGRECGLLLSTSYHPYYSELYCRYACNELQSIQLDCTYNSVNSICCPVNHDI
jgi:hypothetical protein